MSVCAAATQSFVQEEGSFVENGFWMDAIKTHCYVTYESAEVVRIRMCVSLALALVLTHSFSLQARNTRDSLDGKVWPPVSGIALCAVFSQETAMDVHANGEAARSSLKRKASSDLDPSSRARGKSAYERAL